MEEHAGKKEDVNSLIMSGCDYINTHIHSALICVALKHSVRFIPTIKPELPQDYCFNSIFFTLSIVGMSDKSLQNNEMNLFHVEQFYKCSKEFVSHFISFLCIHASALYHEYRSRIWFVASVTSKSLQHELLGLTHKDFTYPPELA